MGQLLNCCPTARSSKCWRREAVVSKSHATQSWPVTVVSAREWCIWDMNQVARETTSMRKQANATFALKSWDEKTYNEIEGAPKLTRVSATKSYQGDIEGEGNLEYLMMYSTADSASFIGLERVTGTIGGRSGSFVLQHNGTFEGGVAKVILSVVPGSWTGGLSGI